MSRSILPFRLAYSLAYAALLCALGTGVARAAPVTGGPSTWSLDVAQAGACAKDPSFAQSLDAQIPAAKRPAPGAAADLVASVRFDSPTQASVHVLDGRDRHELGARDIQLSGKGCASAGETIGFVLGVLFQTEHGFPAEEEPLPDAPEPPPPPPPPPAPPPTATPRRVVNERYAWLGPRPAHELSLSAGVLRGLLPGWPPGGRVAWTIRAQRTWPITLWVAGWRAADTEVASSTFGATYGGLSVCPLHIERERFHVRACAGAGVGAAWAEARDRRLNDTGKWREPIGLVGLHPNLALRIAGPLFLELTVHADAALPRRSFYYTKLNQERRGIYRTSWVMGAAFLGLSLRFR